MKTINIKDIKEITLLSKEEAGQLDRGKLRRKNDDWCDWWLRTPCNDFIHHTYVVGSNGGVFYDSVFFTRWVRPALRINELQSYNLKEEEEVECLGKTWIAIGVDDLILMKDFLFSHRFDATSNDYEKSEIKQVINDWLVARKVEAIMKEYNANSPEELEQRLIEFGAVE